MVLAFMGQCLSLNICVLTDRRNVIVFVSDKMPDQWLGFPAITGRPATREKLSLLSREQIDWLRRLTLDGLAKLWL